MLCSNWRLNYRSKPTLLATYLVFNAFSPQIIETENMMDRIVNGLSESSIKVRLAAVRYEYE